ncbi:hypothetical protein [Xanthomonas albilineans]|uniref:hypothetical protein n=1 Tax=Xanthomonas albilineans TaxID=29447 RepID=UPI0005F3579F|nr:hypothetical protein [Xanthomonas albilineans]
MINPFREKFYFMRKQQSTSFTTVNFLTQAKSEDSAKLESKNFVYCYAKIILTQVFRAQASECIVERTVACLRVGQWRCQGKQGSADETSHWVQQWHQHPLMQILPTLSSQV